MPGKVLIIDSVAINRIVLRVKLSAAGYTVIQAVDGAEGLSLVKAQQPDIVLSSSQLSDMTITTLLEALRESSESEPPAVFVMSEGNSADNRLEMFAAGAHDVVSGPLEIDALLARFRAALRTRVSLEDAHLHQRMMGALGLAEVAPPFKHETRVAILAHSTQVAREWQAALADLPECTCAAASIDDAMAHLAQGPTPDILILEIGGASVAKQIALMSDLRAGSATRSAKIIAVLPEPDPLLIREALDHGADDLLSHGFWAEEMSLRLLRQANEKQRENLRRANMHEGLRAATIDPLTGLYNRRYAMPHLARVAQASVSNAQNCAVMMIDVDHFKSVNDIYGHDAGDAVLVELAKLLKTALRAGDVASRIGGEEFMIVLPQTSVAEAQSAARRLCKIVSGHDFRLPSLTQPFHLTVSIGVAVARSREPCDGQIEEVAETLFREADTALYGSKSHGRNRVTLSPRSAA